MRQTRFDVRLGLAGWRDLLVFRQEETGYGSQAASPWPKLLVSFLVVVATTAAVVLIDHFTGPRQSVLPLYAVLVAWTAWRLGLMAGGLVALGVSSTWLAFNATAIDGVGVWNALARFGALVLLAYLAAIHRLVTSALATVARLASTDILTGALNRRAFAQAVHREVARCHREQAPLSVVYFDLDRFKEVNDTKGHSAGDELLVTIAEIAQNVLRATDVLARVGGDEFAVILPCTGADEALRVADRIRGAIEATASPRFGVTASVGLVTWQVPPESSDALLEGADHRMYQAKQSGGNRVCQTTVSTSGVSTPKPDGQVVVLRSMERS